MGGILRMRTMPALGGDTLFADTAAIWRDLPDRVKERIADLRAEHDILQSFGGRVSDEREELRRTTPPVSHPVARTHPETGEKAYVNRTFTAHRGRRRGGEPRAAALPHQPREAAGTGCACAGAPTPSSSGNRPTQHYAVLDYWPGLRVVERVTVVGDRPV